MIRRFDKRKYRVVYSIVFNLIAFGLFILFTDLKYEIQDNYYFSLFIADGYYKFGFMSYFFGILCGFLQKLIFPINAFTVLHLFFSYAAFVTLTAVFINKFRYVVGTVFSTMVIGLFAVNHYSNISFTRDAALFVVVGFLCMLHFMKERGSVFPLIVGGLFVFLSSIYRFEVFLAGAAIIAFYILGKDISDSIKDEKRSLSGFFKVLFEKKRLISLLLVVALCFCGYFASRAICNATESDRYFLEYNDARSYVWDYPIPDYNECQNEYDSIGIDEEDIKILRNGYMDDQGGYTLEKLQQIHAIQEEYNAKNTSYISEAKILILSEFYNIIRLNEQGVAIIGTAVILLMFLIVMRKRNYFIPLSLMAVSFILLMYLNLAGRVPFRAVYVIWLTMFILLMYSLSNEELRKWVFKIPHNGKIIALLVFAILELSFCVPFSVNANTTIPSLANDSNVQELRAYMQDNKEKTFELTRSVVVDDCADVYHIDNILDNNYLIFNCTYYRSEFYEKQLAALNIDNMYEDLINKDIYLVDSISQPHIQMIKNHLDKYYSKTIISEADRLNGYVIYRLSSVNS